MKICIHYQHGLVYGYLWWEFLDCAANCLETWQLSRLLREEDSQGETFQISLQDCCVVEMGDAEMGEVGRTGVLDTMD